MSRAGRPWTNKELEVLKKRMSEGVSYLDISLELDRPFHGVKTKANKSGLCCKAPRQSKTEYVCESWYENLSFQRMLANAEAEWARLMEGRSYG